MHDILGGNMGNPKRNLTNNAAIEAKPFFSILIPSYNRPSYLEKCLESILENDFNDFEIIISDDDSTEIKEIKRVIEPYLKYENITFIKQSHNIGMANNWNFLVSYARGKYLIILGDDDNILSCMLSRLKCYIEDYPDYDLYGFGYNVIDEHDMFCYSRCSPKIFEISLAYPKFIRSLFVSGIIPFWTFHPFTICYKKQVTEQIKYNEGAFIGSDLLFLFDCVNIGKKMLVIPEVLFCWRKMQGKSRKGYQNLSNFRGSSITARKNILYILKHRDNLQPCISKLISSYFFRKRFLYDPIVIEKSMVKYRLDSLDLNENYLKELSDLCRIENYFYHKLRIKLYQVFDYFKLFGFKGIFGLLLLSYYKLNFAIKKIKLWW